ncbi:AAA family ATPase [Palleronia rufa]|uniref:nucleotide-binding protein n=1 Tax=Palleronia rufa TaxID=1530186 RepID=UPI00056D40CA|nr:AAA family ATPase [Palleronia rufa]
MIVVTAMSTKGGSGKTTLMMALATGLLERGMRVHIMDFDNDSQIALWEQNSDRFAWDETAPRVSWPDALTLSVAPVAIEDVYSQLNELESRGVDVVLLDNRPGNLEENEDVVLAADIVLLPVRPEHTDYQMAERTLRWAEATVATLEEGQPAPIFRCVVTQLSTPFYNLLTAGTPEEIAQATAKVANADRAMIDFLRQLPCLPTPIRDTKQLFRISATGPLTVARDTFLSGQGTARHAHVFKEDIEMCADLADDVMDAVKATNKAAEEMADA